MPPRIPVIDGETGLPFGQPTGPTRKARAVMRAFPDFKTGSVVVNCPYCLMYWQLPNPVDVTKFVETDGKRFVKTECSKGHKLEFKPIDQWRETRMKAGIQVKP